MSEKVEDYAPKKILSSQYEHRYAEMYKVTSLITHLDHVNSNSSLTTLHDVYIVHNASELCARDTSNFGGWTLMNCGRPNATFVHRACPQFFYVAVVFY